MSGHSKWATTKRQKAVTDAKRGAVFTKMANAITVAAREKGGDPSVNFSLRMAVDKARAANIPKENIERAIKRGTGEGGGAAIEEIYYEGIGPAHSQFIIKCLTDNKNRSAAAVRHIFSKYGGSLGSVSWNFEKRGVIRILSDQGSVIGDQEELELIDCGAQDIKREEEGIIFYTDLEDLQKVEGYLENKNIKVESAEIEFVAKEEAEVDPGTKESIEKFIMELEDNEDVSDYYTNMII
jgi:YebC/PmpR family DNA-binding regulatory protein